MTQKQTITPTVRSVYDTLLNSVSERGVRGHELCWLYRQDGDAVEIINCTDLLVRVEKDSIRFFNNRRFASDGALRNMPYLLQFNIAANGKSVALGKTQTITYWDHTVCVPDGVGAVYTDVDGLQPEVPVTHRVAVPARRKEVVEYVRKALLNVFAAAKLLPEPEGGAILQYYPKDPTVIGFLANPAELQTLVESSFVWKNVYGSGTYTRRMLDPKKEVKNFITRNAPAIYTMFGVYEGMTFVPPPAA